MLLFRPLQFGSVWFLGHPVGSLLVSCLLPVGLLLVLITCVAIARDLSIKQAGIKIGLVGVFKFGLGHKTANPFCLLCVCRKNGILTIE